MVNAHIFAKTTKTIKHHVELWVFAVDINKEP